MTLPERADKRRRTLRMLLPALLIVTAVGVISFSLGDAKTSTTAASQPVDVYTTSFPATENPISEGGVWANGKSTGIDWQDVMTTPEKAFGTQSGSSGAYDDSTALLQGTFGANQEASATVFNDDTGGDWYAEVELRLRSNVKPRSIAGYEIEFRARTDSSAYCDIVRWNGAVGDFTPLLHLDGSQCAIRTGDVLRARIVGNTLSAYKNDTLVMQVSDGTFSSGNPGMGFWLHNMTAAGNAANFGFTSFTAQTLADGAQTSILSASLRLVPQVTHRL